MDSDDDYEEKYSHASGATEFDLTPLLETVQHECSEEDVAFDTVINELLPDLIRARDLWLQQQVREDQYGRPVRPLTRYERALLISDIQSKLDSGHPLTYLEAVILRKLKVQRARFSYLNTTTVTPLPPPRQDPPVNPDVLDALYSIRTTPYESSFLSRLLGADSAPTPGLIAVDWDAYSPWMALMDDIRDHHSLAQQADSVSAPIEYVSLQPCHLDQIHDLLARTFWSGIDVSDSLQYSPEKCTVVAVYKKLVVGVAFLSSPQETYITYLAVRTGWENAQIATNMLYHLITLNPNKDITLHVSVNNPAMLLYNRFGFKAEEFIVGFYDAYLDPQSRASKNAFRLRLRR
ncbi:hypothetical protein GLOTRDRAFT_105554 [Gloeophyllum trabeum ATCC 11539]|uniref:N-acetyltransferase domain-containing protein n=1 Tax=Gloeophyllum trabeum (strain ATCC 11539 / FP-39264 / Madison 617) TaxID=670483 RepID=S7RU78_GLOTA|nr:uncharacterized protein GLOTRDRAFT_105554 [Gloeophyllum trabeum ATCC 11539]EPQ56734.1 hypothetical protein GLOTRDRAFT_105554 [Gloeophyllum trabeum ATCC 11539]